MLSCSIFHHHLMPIMSSSAANIQRKAQIFIGGKESNRAVRVQHPGKLTSADIKAIDDILINKVIKDLTGCSCLSGIIDVIWERNFERVIDVKLGEPFRG
jgi:hypothetical protein